MGTWNAGLFSNDTTLDVRGSYIDLLTEQNSNEDSYSKICDEYRELMDTDEEPLFWYALADTQWNTGRLMPEVKEKALQFIEELGGIDLWEDLPKKAEKWKNTLQKLKETLESPMPPEKTFKKPKDFITNPWNTGDIYAYQFNQKEAVESGILGKYMVIQKVGDNFHEYEKISFYNSVIRIFDKVFQEIPTLEDLKGIRFLPMVYPPIPDKKNLDFYLEIDVERLNERNYAKKHYTFIGHNNVPEKVYTRANDTHWKNLEHWFIDSYFSWKGIEY